MMAYLKACVLSWWQVGETVSIAAKIKNTKLTTAKEELETWDSVLRAFELLGMKVGFLRNRKHLLATFLFDSEAEPDIQSYVKSKYELERVESKIPKVEEKLKALKESAKKCANVLDSLRHKVETHENIFKELGILLKGPESSHSSVTLSEKTPDAVQPPVYEPT
ncbi:DNA-binding pseudobarrel domain-containing protein [Artemisia annua]|uniref:DNA-binding pseudobarrel domain-containing protein n=1 Tax=Artemisia annua TaxID=35608 RepID=A0A2U1PS74_ARTAN|nr:DNA-binding pseudobarrel domain-containing protein [Artemisia annua]